MGTISILAHNNRNAFVRIRAAINYVTQLDEGYAGALYPELIVRGSPSDHRVKFVVERLEFNPGFGVDPRVRKPERTNGDIRVAVEHHDMRLV